MAYWTVAHEGTRGVHAAATSAEETVLGALVDIIAHLIHHDGLEAFVTVTGERTEDVSANTVGTHASMHDGAFVDVCAIDAIRVQVESFVTSTREPSYAVLASTVLTDVHKPIAFVNVENISIVFIGQSFECKTFFGAQFFERVALGTGTWLARTPTPSFSHHGTATSALLKKAIERSRALSLLVSSEASFFSIIYAIGSGFGIESQSRRTITSKRSFGVEAKASALAQIAKHFAFVHVHAIDSVGSGESSGTFLVDARLTRTAPGFAHCGTTFGFQHGLLDVVFADAISGEFQPTGSFPIVYANTPGGVQDTAWLALAFVASWRISTSPSHAHSW